MTDTLRETTREQDEVAEALSSTNASVRVDRPDELGDVLVTCLDEAGEPVSRLRVDPSGTICVLLSGLLFGADEDDEES